MKSIRILTPDIDLLGEIRNYESNMFTRSWHGIGSLELRINRHKQYTDTLQKGNIIVIGNDPRKAYLIVYRGVELNEEGKISEDWHIIAHQLKAVIGRRITVPPVHTSHDNKSGAAESVMKHYIDRNIVNPVDGRRKIPQLVIAPDLQRGMNIDWQSRFKNLAEETADISLLSGIGWDVYVDYDTKKWVFDVYEGKDISVNQDVHDPVVFSPQFGNIKDMQFVDSDLNYRNVAVVAGQGEGVDRRVIEVGQATGLDRYETFVDARDVSEETDDEEPVQRPIADIERDLTNRGNQQLAELGQEIYLEGQVLMGVKKERVPQKVDGTAEDVRLDEVDLWENRNTVTRSSDYNVGWTRYLGATATFKVIEPHKKVEVFAEGGTSILKTFRSVSNVGVNVGDTVTIAFDIENLSDTYPIVVLLNAFNNTMFTINPGEIVKFNSQIKSTTGSPQFQLRTSTVNGHVHALMSPIFIAKGVVDTTWQPAPEDNIPWYEPSKTVNLAPINLSRLGRYQSSRFTFNASTPSGTSAIVEYSLDNQAWHPLQSGGSLPFQEGDWLNDKVVYLRQRLSTSDQTISPSISGFKYEINGYHTKESVSTATFVYEDDWNLGDIVSLQNQDWGVTLDSRITEVTEVYERDGMQLSAVFGQSRPTLISKIKQELAGMKNEIVR